jgi:catechol 2,3-dioxygenase-like lactoylglutathione lyase family enzyme
LKQDILNIALIVNDYDEAIQFYTQKLGFVLIEDTVLSETKRWVIIAPPGSNGCRLLLAKAANEHQQSRVGDQTGGRVFLFLHTDDFWRDYNNLKLNNVTIIREPIEETWGTVAVFADLYGNLWEIFGT